MAGKGQVLVMMSLLCSNNDSVTAKQRELHQNPETEEAKQTSAIFTLSFTHIYTTYCGVPFVTYYNMLWENLLCLTTVLTSLSVKDAQHILQIILQIFWGVNAENYWNLLNQRLAWHTRSTKEITALLLWILRSNSALKLQPRKNK